MWLGSWTTSTRSAGGGRRAGCERPRPAGPGGSPRPAEREPLHSRSAASATSRGAASDTRSTPPARSAATIASRLRAAAAPRRRPSAGGATASPSAPGSMSAGGVFARAAIAAQRERIRAPRLAAVRRAADPRHTARWRARARADVEQGLLGRVGALDRRHVAERGDARRKAPRRSIIGGFAARRRRGPGSRTQRGRRGGRAVTRRRRRDAARRSDQRERQEPARSGLQHSLGSRATEPSSDASKLRQVHVPEGRPGLAPPSRGRARGAQARVPGRLRELRGRPVPARLLAGRHARRRGPDALDGEPRASRTSTSSTSCSARAA